MSLSAKWGWNNPTLHNMGIHFQPRVSEKHFIQAIAGVVFVKEGGAHGGIIE
jgi:hypothetical protein